MITLITGVPGSGKTLYTIGKILEAVKEGRDVYSDIDGLSIDGVEKAPDDWRDTPDGSLVVYDECQQKYGPEGAGGRSSRPDIAAMEIHRHTGHDLILITQHANLLHSHVRRLVGKHHHVSRVMGGSVAKIYTQDKAFKTDSRRELQLSDEQTWTYPKKHFQHYKSATVHTHKFKIPTKVKYGIATMAVLVCLAVALGMNTRLFRPTVPDIVENNQSAQPYMITPDDHPVVVNVIEEKLPLMGCIATDRFCTCYTEEMTPLAVSEAECRNTISKPLPRRLGVGDGRSSRAPARQPTPQEMPSVASSEPYEIKIPRYYDQQYNQ